MIRKWQFWSALRRNLLRQLPPPLPPPRLSTETPPYGPGITRSLQTLIISNTLLAVAFVCATLVPFARIVDALMRWVRGSLELEWLAILVLVSKTIPTNPFIYANNPTN